MHYRNDARAAPAPAAGVAMAAGVEDRAPRQPRHLVDRAGQIGVGRPGPGWFRSLDQVGLEVEEAVGLRSTLAEATGPIGPVRRTAPTSAVEIGPIGQVRPTGPTSAAATDQTVPVRLTDPI
jgi:hypothetical protein